MRSPVPPVEQLVSKTAFVGGSRTGEWESTVLSGAKDVRSPKGMTPDGRQIWPFPASDSREKNKPYSDTSHSLLKGNTMPNKLATALKENTNNVRTKALIVVGVVAAVITAGVVLNKLSQTADVELFVLPEVPAAA